METHINDNDIVLAKKYCENCNKYQAKDNNYCPDCGNKLILKEYIESNEPIKGKLIIENYVHGWKYEEKIKIYIDNKYVGDVRDKLKGGDIALELDISKPVHLLLKHPHPFLHIDYSRRINPNEITRLEISWNHASGGMRVKTYINDCLR